MRLSERFAWGLSDGAPRSTPPTGAPGSGSMSGSWAFKASSLVLHPLELREADDETGGRAPEVKPRSDEACLDGN